MKCFYHPDRKAEKSCSQCGRFVCDECSVELEEGVWCKSCVERGLKGKKEKTESKEEKKSGEKKESEREEKERRPAGAISRLVAGGIDFALSVPVSVIVYGVVTSFRSFMPGAFFAAFLGLFFYDFFFTAVFGRTLGKLILAMRVKREGGKPGLVFAALRSLAKTLLLFLLVVLPASMGEPGAVISLVLALLTFVVMAFKKRAPYDYLAGTRVVH